MDLADDQRSDLVEAGAIAAYSHPDGWPFAMANRETKDYFRAMSARMLTAVAPLIEKRIRAEVGALFDAPLAALETVTPKELS